MISPERLADAVERGVTRDELLSMLSEAWNEGFEQGEESEQGGQWTGDPYAAAMSQTATAAVLRDLLAQHPRRIQVRHANGWYDLDMVALGPDGAGLYLVGGEPRNEVWTGTYQLTHEWVARIAFQPKES